MENGSKKKNKDDNKKLEKLCAMLLVIIAFLTMLVVVLACILINIAINPKSSCEINNTCNSINAITNETNSNSFIDIRTNKINSENTINYNNTNENNPDECNEISPYEYTYTDKPIIYIYPTQKMDVEVKLGNPQYLSCTYPKYKDSWQVTANIDGTLVDKKTGRNLYALYWESNNAPRTTNMKEGFCIKGTETATFLEDKLCKLGLSDREIEEFIIYWLPKMENNNYNYIRFETKEEQDKSMPLEVNPKPDNVIRVMMDWKGLDEKIIVEEQKLEQGVRNGYTVVEWGASEIK